MTLDPRIRAYYFATAPDTTIDVLPFAAGDVPLTELVEASRAEPAPYRVPVFACTAQTFRPAPALPGLEVVTLSSDSPLADVQENYDINARGFDPSAAPAATADVETFRATLVTSRAFTARLNHQPAAAGMFNPPLGGVAELVGITTLADYRQRGIAAALTSEMVRVAFEQAVDTPILTTDNLIAYRVYQRLGFYPAALLITNHRD